MRNAVATAEGWEAVPASGALVWRRELDACWAPVQVVVAAVACWPGPKRPARVVEMVVVDAGAPGRAEPPVAVEYRISPSRSGLVKSAMVQAETRMGSEAPALPKRLRAPEGAEAELALL